MSMIHESQARALCRSRFVEPEPTDGFVLDTRTNRVVSGPFENMDVARAAARQLNDYVARTTGTRPFKAYQP